MKNKKPHAIKFVKLAPIFCSFAVLSTQVQAAPSLQFFGDNTKENMVTSGKLGYVGGDTKVGVSVDKDFQGQVDLSQVINKSDSALTSADVWLGYKLKDDSAGDKGAQGGGAKLNHQWVSDEKDRVHKVFGAYDQNQDDHAKATVGYGQEQEDLFWSGHVSKGMGSDNVVGDVTTRSYDYGVGGEVGTFLDDSLARVRVGADYEFGTDYSDGESRPSNLTISAGVQKFFQDSPHSVSLDVSGNKSEGGNSSDNTDYNARLGYQYEFGGGGAFQSEHETKRVRVQIPGTPGRAAIPAVAAVAGQPAVPAKYKRQLVKRPGFKLVKTTMKLENETFFEKNSSKLTHSAVENLNKITQQIRSHGYVGAIRVTGNTCGLGSAAYDQKLSERRAKEVRDYLIAKGVNPKHLIARGLGKNHPKYVKKDTGFKNRRVDIEYVTERSAKKQNTTYKNVLVQPGRPAIAAKPGRAFVPAVPGTPARYVWNTKVVKSTPVWIKRALHNSIRHNKTVNTYSTQAAPTTTDDSYTITSGSTTLDVLGNDSAGLSLVSVTQPANGSVTIANGQVVYVPNPGFSGTDTFTYTVRDSEGNLITSNVDINVPTAINNMPTAVDDADTTPLNTPVIISVLGNDTDPENDTLDVTSFTQGTSGSVAEDANGNLVYTPNTGFIGSDSFTYVISDGNGGTDTATVNVTVTAPANTAPTANNDSQNISCTTSPVTINVIGNDTDPESDALNVSSTTNGQYGTTSISGNQVVYTPNGSGCGLADSFEYTITDGNGNSSTATVTVNAAAANTAPDAVDDANITPFNTSVTIDVLDNDSDPENDTLTVLNYSQGASGSVSEDGNGNLIYTPNAGFVGADSFTYTITDGNGGSDTATVNVTVTGPVNTAPDAVDDADTTSLNSPVTITVLDNDSDPENDTLSVSNYTQGANGSVSEDGNGNLIYTPNAGFVGADSFTYTITDGNGGSDTATVNVTVTGPANMAPTANNDTQNIVCSTAPVSIDVIGNDTDPENDTLTVSGSTYGAYGTTTIAGNQVVYTPNGSGCGLADSFEYTISDGNGNTSTATVTVNTAAANSAPVAVDDADTTPLNTPVTIDVLDNDSDPEGDTLSVLNYSQGTSGSVSEDVNGNLIYTPNAGFVGTDSFTYLISDGNGGTDTATVNVTVTAPPNMAPMANNDTQNISCSTAPVSIDVIGNDTDPENDTLTVSGSTAGTYGTTSIVGNQVVYTPNGSGCGLADSFDYTISDGNGNTSTATVTVNTAANTAPTAVDDSDTTPRNTAVTISVLGNDTDPEGDTLSLMSYSQGTNGSVSEDINGNIIYTPNTGYIGSDTFTYTISDGNGGSDTATVNVTITNQNPIAVDDVATVTYETPETINVAANDTDPDGVTTCVANIVSHPTNGSVTISGTGVDIVYTPFNGYSGPDSFVYTACDNDGGTDTATVDVTVSLP